MILYLLSTPPIWNVLKAFLCGGRTQAEAQMRGKFQ